MAFGKKKKDAINALAIAVMNCISVKLSLKDIYGVVRMVLRPYEPEETESEKHRSLST